MRTKHLLFALAMPVAFAACTSEDYLSEMQESPVTTGRKVVGKVSFVMDETETRTQYLNGLQWTEGDLLGAALMDQVKSEVIGGTTDWNTDDATQNYSLIDQTQSNYKYTYKDGAFTNNDAVFVEGNYFIYGQHREQGRMGLKFDIPVEQFTGAESPAGSWEKNQMFLDHIFVKEGESSVKVNPMAVFPIVGFNVATEVPGVEIQRIRITDSKGLANVSVMKPSKTADYNPLSNATAIKAADGTTKYLEKYDVVGGTIADVFNAYKEAVKDFNDKKFEVTKPANFTLADIASPILADFFEKAADECSNSLELTFENGEKNKRTGTMVWPLLDTHEEKNVKIEIYTNKGIVTIDGSGVDSENFDLASDLSYVLPIEGTVKERAKKATAYTNVKNLLTAKTAGEELINFRSLNIDKRVSINFKEEAILVPEEIEVSSTEEMENYLKNWYTGAKSKLSENDVTIKVKAGKTVEITDYVVTFMSDTENNPIVNFEGDVVIPAGIAAADVLNKLNKGTGDLNVTNKSDNQIYTDEEKVYTKITNEGTLTISGENDDDNKTVFATTDIVNLGTMTVGNNASVQGLTNGTNKESEEQTAVLNIAKASVASLTNYATTNATSVAEVTNMDANKILTVAEGAMLKTSGTLYNTGEVRVAAGGAWRVGGAFTNMGNDEEGKTVGTITNKGAIVVDGVFNNGVADNANKSVAKIVNEGEMSVQEGSSNSFSNSGLIEAKKSSITLLTNNYAEGEILVEKGLGVLTLKTGEDGHKITFIATANGDVEEAGKVNTNVAAKVNNLRVKASGSISLEKLPTSISSIHFIGESGMQIDCKNKTVDNVTFDGGASAGKQQFSLNGGLKVSNKFIVKKNASIIVNDDVTVSTTAVGEYTNEGSIFVSGTLTFSGLTKDALVNTLGNCQSTGGETSNITFKK